MRLLRAEAAEPDVADDLRGAEVLELGGVGAGLGGQMDQRLGAFQIAVVVGGDVGDEIGWLAVTDEPRADRDRPRHW